MELLHFCLDDDGHGTVPGRKRGCRDGHGSSAARLARAALAVERKLAAQERTCCVGKGKVCLFLICLFLAYLSIYSFICLFVCIVLFVFADLHGPARRGMCSKRCASQLIFAQHGRESDSVCLHRSHGLKPWHTLLLRH